MALMTSIGGGDTSEKKLSPAKQKGLDVAQEQWLIELRKSHAVQGSTSGVTGVSAPQLGGAPSVADKRTASSRAKDVREKIPPA